MRISGMDATASVNATNLSKQVSTNVSTPIIQKTNLSDRQQQQSNAADKPTDEKAVTEAVGKMNKLLEGTSRSVAISVHERTHEIMVKVVDDQTGEVIREVPPKKLIDMIANMLEMAGLIVDERR